MQLIPYIAASLKAIFWTVMWFFVLFGLSLLEWDFTVKGDTGTKNIEQLSVVVESIVYSYVGSIGAEAFIRYWDGINWNKLPNLQQVFLVDKDFNLKHLTFCFVATISWLAIIRYTEVSSVEELSLRFTATSIADLPYDSKFMLVLLVGMVFRTFIYFSPSPISKQTAKDS